MYLIQFIRGWVLGCDLCHHVRKIRIWLL